VRTHTGAIAEQSTADVNADAYTGGHNIVFGAGRFVPGTIEGRRLLAHELTHVVQQRGAAGRTIQRAPDDPAVVDPPAPGKDDPAESAALAGGRVTRVIIATTDGLFVIETPSTDYLYELNRWQIDPGSYTATVSKTPKGLKFDFGKDFADFYFTYTIAKGQDNPASLLKGQKTVTVDVVATHDVDPDAKPIQCLLPMQDRVIIDEYKSKIDLFPAVKKQRSWYIGSVPLGFLGWIDIDADAGLSLAGLLSYGYGPGMVRDICLYRSLGGGVFGGTARFTFGAALSPSVNFKGGFRVKARYVGAFKLASAEATLEASAIGRASGKLDSRVDLSYDTKKDKWKFDLAAQLSGAASLKLTATASAAITLLWKEVWSKQWKLLDADFGIGWKGGVRIGTDTKTRFDFGSVGILSDDDKPDPGGPSLEAASAADPLAPKSEVDDTNVLEASINRETGDPERTPNGESEGDALPFVWYKPLEIYPRKVLIPRASSPHELDRDDGPTKVTYDVGRGANTVPIGVRRSNWPYARTARDRPGKTFLYVPDDPGNVEKDALKDVFNQRLLPVGETLRGNGFDLDHVHEKQFGGKDAYSNLWPADYQENQLAGTRHDHQLAEYRQTVGAIDGRWFEIVEFRRASSAP
jgi:hypothetical protein